MERQPPPHASDPTRSAMQHAVAGVDRVMAIASAVGAATGDRTAMAIPSPPFNREGWLRKRGQHNTLYKWRWCVLEGPTLLYYRGGRSNPVVDLRGKMNLSGASIEVDLEASHEISIATVSGREYVLELPRNSTREAQRWVAAICHASRQGPPADAARCESNLGDAAASRAAKKEQSARLCTAPFLPSSSSSLATAAARVDPRHRSLQRAATSSAVRTPATLKSGGGGALKSGETVARAASGGPVLGRPVVAGKPVSSANAKGEPIFLEMSSFDASKGVARIKQSWLKASDKAAPYPISRMHVLLVLLVFTLGLTAVYLLRANAIASHVQADVLEVPNVQPSPSPSP